tara:strand:- start:921 stop:1151 length:231 start_codon:yes stop_codon:yes gene_type:complete
MTEKEQLDNLYQWSSTRMQLLLRASQQPNATIKVVGFAGQDDLIFMGIKELSDFCHTKEALDFVDAINLNTLKEKR